MNIKRFYVKQDIELAQVRGIRGVLLAELKWEISENEFILTYPGEELKIDDFDKLSQAVKNRGKPNCVFVTLKSASGDALEIQTCGPNEVVIELKSDDPDRVFSEIEPLLGLTRVTDVVTPQVIRSAFIAHAFDDEGRQYAGEVSHFLELVYIRSESGRTFSPGSIREKVLQRLARHDMFVAIITPQDDDTWLTQECAVAVTSKKPVFLLKSDDTQFKHGLLGDLEYIPFPKGQISRTFVHILEGIKEVQ
jgi:hypothetical protein